MGDKTKQRCEVNKFGRVLYVEPTNLIFEGDSIFESQSTIDIFNPLEDYCVSVDLKVIVTDRESCGLSSKTGEQTRLEYTTATKTLTFFRGSGEDGALTTNYTNIDLLNPDMNTEECLGIESINIAYNSWLYPEVNIKFVDVRGASVFAKQEKEFQNGQAVHGTGVELYRSFFTFPYPQFQLVVKGFYGYGATYYLTIEDVNLTFDSSSGNFDINVKFIGMMYRIYTDIPMLYACVAPYMEVGQSHWDEMVNQGHFVFHSPDGGVSGNMIKFPELAKRLVQATYSKEAQDLQNEESKYVEDYETKSNMLKGLKLGPFDEGEYFVGTERVAIVVTDKEFKDISAKIKIYVDLAHSYDEKSGSGTKFSDYCYSLEKYVNEDSKPEKTIEVNKNTTQSDWVINGLSEKDKTEISNKIKGEGKWKIFIIDKDDTFDKEKLGAAVTDEENRLNKEKSETEDSFKKKKDEMIEAMIGFKPSIKNMYDLAFAHMDTFVYCFYDTLKHIKESINSGRREISQFTVSDIDYPNGRSNQLPPFPALYQTKTQTREGASITRDVEVWLEEIKNGGNLEEVSLVNDLINASCYYSDKMTSVSKEREELEQMVANSSGDTSGFPSMSATFSYIPLTPYDLMNKNTSPYSYLSGLFTSEDETSLSSALFTFMHRAFYFCWVNNGLTPNQADAFGRMEAWNFYKAVGKKNSNMLISLKTKFGENFPKASNLCFNGGTVEDNTLKNAWSGFGNNFNDYLFDNINSKAVYSFSKYGFKPFPLGYFSPVDVKKNLTSINAKKLTNDESIIPLSYGENSEYIKNNKSFFINTSGVKWFGETIEADILNKSGVFEDVTPTNNAGSTILGVGTIQSVIGLNKLFMDGGYNFFRDEKGGMKTFDQCKDKDSTFVKYGISTTSLKKFLKDVNAENAKDDFLAWYCIRFMLERMFSKTLDSNFLQTKVYDKITLGKYPKILLLLGGFGFTNSKTNVTNKYDTLWRYYKSWYAENKAIIDKWINHSNDFALNSSTIPDFVEYDTKNETEEFKKLQNFLRDLFFTQIEVCDLYVGKADKKLNAASCSVDVLESALSGFKDELLNVYQDLEPQEAPVEYENPETRDIRANMNHKDVKLATYITLKTLYDKWLAAPYKGEDTWNFASEKSDFKCFEYIDSFYHKIGLDISTDISAIAEWITECMPSSDLDGQTLDGLFKDKSVIDYLMVIAQNCGGILMAFPNSISMHGSKDMASIFRPIPYISPDWRKDESCFVFVYHYKPSEHLGTSQYLDDGVDLMAEEVIGSLSDDGYNIPAFGVTFAKQNQSIFKNISLSTENAAVTEASIASTGAIASKGSSSPRDTTLFGQDLYRVRTSYAYQCEFDMMGNVQVMPLMYFQLNNVPFWRGAYMIYKVSHQITQGDMTTHVVGVRINKYTIPITDGVVVTNKNSYSSYAGGNSGPLGVMMADKPYEIPTGDAINLTPDFDENNVSEQNPIICLTPAHGPNVNEKTAEWYWSNMIVDSLQAKLKAAGYNTQKCNKDGAYTDNTTNHMTQVKDIVNKYTKDKVISFVPHWFHGTKQSVVAYYGTNVGGQKYENEKSKTLAEYFAAKTIEVLQDKSLYKQAPLGLILESSNKNASYIDIMDNVVDYGVMLDCACVASVFWSDAYPEDKICSRALTRTALENSSEYKEMNEAKDKFLLSQGWLMSDEGQTTVVNICYEAITAYISSLY